MVYLDWNASAPLHPAARAAWLEAQDSAFANPSSIHAAGQDARMACDAARLTCARLLGCRPHELIQVSGGTEANATAVWSVLHAGGFALCSAIEHSSVLRPAQALVGDRCRRLSVDGAGRLAPETLAEALGDIPTEAPVLVAFQYANNELGTLQDVPALVAAVRARRPEAKILLDASQGAGKAPLNLNALGVDFAALAGHKCGAPKGSGLLYVRNGVMVQPLLRGGRQQQDRRSGTEDPAAMAALAAALTAGLAHQETEQARQAKLLQHVFSTIQAALPQARWLAHEAPRLANTLSLACPDVVNEVLVQRLDLAGFAVSTGAACMAARGEPSHVIRALGVADGLARSAIRVSIGSTSSEAELLAFAAAYVANVRDMLRR
jgi:cysteine desulfurase